MASVVLGTALSGALISWKAAPKQAGALELSAAASVPRATLVATGTEPARARQISRGSDRAPVPRFVSAQQTSPPARQWAVAVSMSATGEAAPPRESGGEIFSALNIPPEQERLVRDVLQLSRDRFDELAPGRESIEPGEFATIIETIVAERNANLGAVLGPEKLKKWQEYQRSRAPQVAQEIAARYQAVTGQAP